MGELSGEARAEMLDQCLAELAPRFNMTAVVELGISYRIAETKRRVTVGLPLAKFPATLALVARATRVLGNGMEDSLKQDGLNVICRRYAPGDRLGFHRDSVGLFGEEIFGAVLTDSGPGLVFRRQGEERHEYAVPEFAGCISVSTGDSRYAWSHGVLPRPEGSATRVSLTWRWLRPATVRWFRIPPTSQEDWVTNFVVEARVAGFSDGVLASFLCSNSPWYCTKNDRLGPLLPAEVVKDALGIQVIPFYVDSDCRSFEHLQLRLELLQWWERSMVPLPMAKELHAWKRRLRGQKQTMHSDSDEPLQFPDLFKPLIDDGADDVEEEGVGSGESTPYATPANRFAALDDSDSECS